MRFLLVWLVCMLVQHASSQKLKTLRTFTTPRICNVTGASVLPIDQSVLLLSSGNFLSVLDDSTFYDLYESTEKLLSFVLDPQCSASFDRCHIYTHTVISTSSSSTHFIKSFQIKRERAAFYIEHSDIRNIYTHTTQETDVDTGMIIIDKKSNHLLFDIHNQVIRISLLGCNPYCVPENNPFHNATFAIGINSLRQCSFDGASSRLVCIDKGNHCGDSIYMIYPRADYGYPSVECGSCTGSCIYPMYYEFPVATYSNSGGSRSGYIYRGIRTKTDYFNKYILLADNKLWKSPGSLSRNTVMSMEEIRLISRPNNYSMNHMFQDASNELYLIGNNGTNNGVFVFTLY